MNLTKKLGPLPIWAWGLILGVGGYFVYSRYASGSSSSSSSTSPVSGVLDPNAVDPNTGLTYGQEEDAALNANAAGGASLGSSGGVSDSGGQATVPSTNEFGDFLTFLDEFNQFGQTLSGLGIVPSTAGATTQAAAASAPVQATSPPTITAAANVSPAQVAQTTQSNTVLSQINSLLSGGFKKIQGTTQAGGLPQTGTYVYTPPKGASIHTGPTKYFVYGTQATGLHIRAAT